MLKKNEKFGVILATLAIAASLSITAFAASNSKPAGEYGTLTGTLNSGGAYKTSVSKNPDTAYLTISGTIQNSAGSTIATQQTIQSPRGRTSFSGSWSYIPSGAYALYGAHGVQGGSRHGAAVVYTYTRN